MKLLLSVVCCTVLLAGCESNEQECLNSERLKFKDPDVVFVANLGNRGLALKENEYWVRYKAKNSYGAYIQGNMLCEKNSQGKWVRAEADEFLQIMTVQIGILKNYAKGLYADDKRIVEGIQRDSKGYPEQMANELIYTSPDDLSMYRSDDEPVKK